MNVYPRTSAIRNVLISAEASRDAAPRASPCSSTGQSMCPGMGKAKSSRDCLRRQDFDHQVGDLEAVARVLVLRAGGDGHDASLQHPKLDAIPGPGERHRHGERSNRRKYMVMED